MDLETFLQLHEAGFDMLVEGARSAARLEEGDRLIAVGSLAEGLGNRKSDLDLLLIVAGDLHSDASPDEVRSFAAGRAVVDLRIVPAEFAEALEFRLATWALGEWDLKVAADFSPSELLLLHRLQAGWQLWPAAGHELGPQADPGTDRIARLKLHVARHMARTIQVDLAGYREEGDARSMVFCAQDLLGHAVDGLLAGFRLTNPTPKWRSRLLERLPSDWERRLVMRPTGLGARDLLWNLHMAPARPRLEAAVQHACRIVTFARAVFLWAEDALVHDGGGDATCAWSQHSTPRGEDPLPFLDLDVDFHRTSEGVTLARLNAFGEMLHMDLRDFAILLLFDNLTSAKEAASVIAGGVSETPEVDLEAFAEAVRRSSFSLAA